MSSLTRSSQGILLSAEVKSNIPVSWEKGGGKATNFQGIQINSTLCCRWKKCVLIWILWSSSISYLRDRELRGVMAVHGWDLGVGHHLNFKIRKTGVRKGVFSVFFIMVLIQVTSSCPGVLLQCTKHIFSFKTNNMWHIFLILIKVLQNLDVGMHGHLKIKWGRNSQSSVPGAKF